MLKEQALRIWEREFGDVDYAHDFTGRKIKRADYEVENQVGWVVSYVKPLALGGPQNVDNEIIMHRISELEKGKNYPDFEVVGVKYRACHDKKDDYYYIEKVMD